MEKETKKSEKPPFKYKSQYGVIVMCDDEKAQERVYNDLLSKGYKLKVVSV